MKKFVMVYYSNNNADDMKEEDMPAIQEAWGKWYESIGESLVDGGNPFASEAKRVSINGVETIVKDEWPSTGYSIINAESIEDATEVAKANPMLVGAGDDVQIRVYECVPM